MFTDSKVQALENIREAKVTCRYKEIAILIYKLSKDWECTDASGIEKIKKNVSLGHMKRKAKVF